MFSPPCASSNAKQCVLFKKITETVTQQGKRRRCLASMTRVILLLLFIISRLIYATVDTIPQQNIDLSRYCGRWYEQARYDNWFEEGLDEVFTDYAAMKNGNIQVTNHGRDAQGHMHQARGRAYVHSNGSLMVSFVWPYWWFHAPYKILYVTHDYQGAVVSGEGDEHLWFLTREEDASPLLLKKLKQEAQLRGFDISKLRYTTHQKRKSTVPDTNKPG